MNLPYPPKENLSRAALAFLVILIAGTMLYPDAYTDSGIALGPIKINATVALFALCAPALLLNGWQKRHFLKLRALDAALLSLIFYISARGLLASQSAGTTEQILAYAAFSTLLYYGTAFICHSLTAVRTVFIALVAMVIFLAVLAIIELSVSRNIVYEQIVQPYLYKNADCFRSSATIGHPNALGLVLLQLTPFLLYFLAVSKKRLTKYFLGLMSLLIVLALISTFSKGSLVTGAALFLLAICWAILKQPGFRKPLASLVAVAAGSFAVFSVLFTYQQFGRIQSYSQFWCMNLFDQAALLSGSWVSIPSLNFTPVIIFARCLNPLSLRQFGSALIASL